LRWVGDEHVKTEINCYVASRDRCVAVGESTGMGTLHNSTSLLAFATDCILGHGMLVLGCLSGFSQMDAFTDVFLSWNSRRPAANQRDSHKERGVYQKL
jgi:hypothetical protein